MRLQVSIFTWLCAITPATAQVAFAQEEDPFRGIVYGKSVSGSPEVRVIETPTSE